MEETKQASVSQYRENDLEDKEDTGHSFKDFFHMMARHRKG